MFTVRYKKYWGLPSNPIIVNTSKDTYNKVPIEFCSNCLSIKLVEEEGLPPYCADCHSSQFGSVHIESWRKLYYYRYHVHPEKDNIKFK